MARFSRIDLEKNINSQIVPLGDYWLAIDTNKYAIGDGNTQFQYLQQWDYNGQIIEYDPVFLVDSPNDVIIDGGDLG